ncbi:SDR family oxidoreductase [Gemmobacter serpentinus]|uniref:SDR family oxidoreductase n=1 Tax=Gemmobacter serpentinus TaxID=2652247 RepID=UPI00124BF0C1|nr:SDR family oxidoreductase [Gemmobacter serpentinus]
MPDHCDTSAVLIGGTQGLGLAIAERLIADGCRKLVVTGRDASRGETAAAGLRALGAEVHFVAGDMAVVADAITAVDAGARHFGRVTALLNAAAATDRGSILDTTPERFDHIFAVNARGAFFALQRFAQLAIQNDHPAQAVNILSMVIHCGQSFLAPYSASKAALANITKNAAHTLRRQRIRVNGINCGWMDTPGEDLIQRKYHGGGDDWLAKAEAKQPMGMLVKPPHVAELASFMLSEASGVMTGALVDFDQTVSGAYPE